MLIFLLILTVLPWAMRSLALTGKHFFVLGIRLVTNRWFWIAVLAIVVGYNRYDTALNERNARYAKELDEKIARQKMAEQAYWKTHFQYVDRYGNIRVSKNILDDEESESFKMEAPHFRDDTIYVRPELVPSPTPQPKSRPTPRSSRENFYVSQ